MRNMKNLNLSGGWISGENVKRGHSRQLNSNIKIIICVVSIHLVVA